MLDFRQPTPSTSLRIFHLLSHRKALTPDDETRKRNQERGLEGELKLHALLQKQLTAPAIPLYGLQLNHGSNECQLDCLLIFHNAIHLLEVKNHDGSFVTADGRWKYAVTMQAYQNPLDQLARAEMLLTAFLKKRNINLPIQAHIIFMNPTFYLYGADVKMPIVFPGQQERFMKQLNTYDKPVGAFQKRVARVFMEAHIAHSRHEYIPAYTYDELRKGIFCRACTKPYKQAPSKYITCENCGFIELAEEATMRAVQAYHVLFPRRKITVNGIMAWTGGFLSKVTIRRYLQKNLSHESSGRGTYYRYP